MKNIKRCTYCVMDDKSDDKIIFDENGQCNYCRNALKRMTNEYFPNELGQKKLERLIFEIKKAGKDKKYDCLMGISGGLDSSYLMYLGHELGLRILAVHIDDGFDTETCKKNIQKVIQKCGIDLINIRPNASEYNDLIKSYLKAGVPNIAAPQDNILFANIYKLAKKEHIKYFLSGGNFSLESILQEGNTHDAYDVKNIKSIQKKFGTKSIKHLEFIGYTKRFIYKKFNIIKTISPLNFINYNRENAIKQLNKFCGYEYYGSKHLENIFTAFMQLYWLPLKFGVDKRKSHLSSMIVSKQISRNDAIKLLEKPLYDKELMDNYINLLQERLQIDEHDFDKIINDNIHNHEEYGYSKTYKRLLKLWTKIKYRRLGNDC